MAVGLVLPDAVMCKNLMVTLTVRMISCLFQLSKVICSECGHVADNTEMMRAHMWTHISNAAAEVVIILLFWNRLGLRKTSKSPGGADCFILGKSSCHSLAYCAHSSVCNLCTCKSILSRYTFSDTCFVDIPSFFLICHAFKNYLF